MAATAVPNMEQPPVQPYLIGKGGCEIDALSIGDVLSLRKIIVAVCKHVGSVFDGNGARYTAEERVYLLRHGAAKLYEPPGVYLDRTTGTLPDTITRSESTEVSGACCWLIGKSSCSKLLGHTGYAVAEITSIEAQYGRVERLRLRTFAFQMETRDDYGMLMNVLPIEILADRACLLDGAMKIPRVTDIDAIPPECKLGKRLLFGCGFWLVKDAIRERTTAQFNAITSREAHMLALFYSCFSDTVVWPYTLADMERKGKPVIRGMMRRAVLNGPANPQGIPGYDELIRYGYKTVNQTTRDNPEYHAARFEALLTQRGGADLLPAKNSTSGARPAELFKTVRHLCGLRVLLNFHNLSADSWRLVGGQAGLVRSPSDIPEAVIDERSPGIKPKGSRLDETRFELVDQRGKNSKWSETQRVCKKRKAQAAAQEMAQQFVANDIVLRKLSELNERIVAQGAAAENDDTADERVQCSICCESAFDTRLDPCGHLFCRRCIVRVRWTSNNCPVCRAPIQRTQPIYLS